MITHPALEDILQLYPFDRRHIQERLFKGALQGVANSPVPDSGSLWWATWASKFCELKFLLPRQAWSQLEDVYHHRCPDIADKGRELDGIMRQEGYSTPDQALAAMIKARDAVG